MARKTLLTTDLVLTDYYRLAEHARPGLVKEGVVSRPSRMVLPLVLLTWRFKGQVTYLPGRGRGQIVQERVGR